MAISAIVHKCRLKRRFYARYFCEINIASQLAAALGLKIKFLNFVPIYHDNAGLFRVRGVDQHLFCHIVHLPSPVARPKAALSWLGIR